MPFQTKIQNLSIGMASGSMPKYKTFASHMHSPSSIRRDNASEERNTMIINTNALPNKDTEPRHRHGIGVNAEVSGKHSHAICIRQVPYVETMPQKKEIQSLSIPIPWQKTIQTLGIGIGI